MNKQDKMVPSRIKILELIGDYLLQVLAWSGDRGSSDALEKALEYAHYAEALIELLEVNDTGNSGGRLISEAIFGSLWERYIVVFNEYNNINKYKFKGLSSFQEMNKVFKTCTK